jgi:hypothetical protein
VRQMPQLFRAFLFSRQTGYGTIPGGNDIVFTPLKSRDSHWAATRDTISNRDAVEIVSEVVAQACGNHSRWNSTTGMQQAAEALTLEAYVRGSRDNIGVVVVALE